MACAPAGPAPRLPARDGSQVDQRAARTGATTTQEHSARPPSAVRGRASLPHGYEEAATLFTPDIHLSWSNRDVVGEVVDVVQEEEVDDRQRLDRGRCHCRGGLGVANDHAEAQDG